MERIDRYELLALVREDGPLSVYLARDPTFGCDVSLETAPVAEVETIAALRADARAKRSASDDVDVRVFEDLDRGLFCVATRKTVRARPEGAKASPSDPSFHTIPRVVPFLLVGAALLACGVAVGATVYMSDPKRSIAPIGGAASVAPSSSASSSGMEIAWEGCPPTTVAISDGCIDARPMSLTDCGPACASSAASCPKDESGAPRACAGRGDAETACARQGGALPTEDQWRRGREAGMKVDESTPEWGRGASSATVDPSNATFRCFHPSDTAP